MIWVSISRVILFCLSTSQLFAQVHAQWCYWPGGEEKALQQFPYDAYAVTTLCCPVGWTCFSNNLCVVTDEDAFANAIPAGTASRGTCTNPLWDNTNCGDFCLGGSGSSNNGSLQNCGNGNFCCESSGSCDCESGTGTFSVPDGEAQTIIGIAELSRTSTTSSIPSSTSQTTAATTSSTSGTSSTFIPAQASSTISTSQQTSSRTSRPPTSSSTDQAAPANLTQPPVSAIHKPGVQAGIAIASIAVAFIILAFLFWFFWYRHRDRHQHEGIPMADRNSDDYHPDPASGVPGPFFRPIPRPTPDPYEFRPVSPVSGRGARGSGMRSGGFAGGHAGQTTDERLRPVVDPYRIPYEGT